MSISGGELYTQQHQDQHEEEKVRSAKPILNKGKSDGTGRKIETKAPQPPRLLMFDGGKDGVSDDPSGHASPPPAGILPQRDPPPTQAHAPKPKPFSNPPIVVEELKERLKKKTSFATPLASPSPHDKEGSPAPTISSNERTTFRRNHNEQTGHEHDPISAASIIVCGVDGTVYTLDACTGKLRNMFPTGPLVITSSPDEDHTSDGTSTDTMNGQGNDNTIDGLDGNLIYAVASKSSHGMKERVIPGLIDGRLYSLWESVGDDDGDKSGECQLPGDEDYDDVEEKCGSITSQDGTSNSQIKPRFEPILTPHHITVKDVVDSPFSICSGGDTQQKQCGIIMGSKKITIYAIEPTTGKVQWTQDPQGGAGGLGYTTNPPKTTARGKTVLLQREDYFVRHTDTDRGKEVWKVDLGMFSALVAPPRGGAQETNSEENVIAGERSARGMHVGGGRKRGVAAIAASVDSQDRKKSVVPPILRRKKNSLHELDDSVFGDIRHAGDRKESLFDQRDDDVDHDHSFRGLPSIAFGKDRKSLMAVDEISRELLWSCQIESEVAIVLGVDKDSKWTVLDVVDEAAILTSGQRSPPRNVHTIGLLPSSSPAYGLTPYGTNSAGNLESIGQHESHLFVRTKFDIVDEVDYPLDGNHLDAPLSPQGETSHGLGHEFGHNYHPQISVMNPSEMAMAGVRRPLSHRTEHGLYLTWSMVSAIVLILLSFVVFSARIIFLRQKRKWEHTPSLDPTNAPSSSEDGNISRPPSAQNPSAPTSGNFHMDIRPQKNLAVPRSWSEGGMGSHAYSPGHNGAQPFSSDINGVTSTFPDQSPSLNITHPNAAPSIIGSKSLPTEASSNDKSRSGVDNIDGIPLVRYSRYTSEYKEIMPLGRGGFGTVFRCRNVLDGREYAIKKIKIVSPLSVDGLVTKQLSQKLHRVLREVKCLALLDHPNIVRYYTAWLEVDQNDGDEETCTTTSLFDRKSTGIFSGGLFSGFGSNSRAMQTPFSKRSSQHRPAKGLLGSYNPLGWNSFGKLRLDESKSFAAPHNDAHNTEICEDDDDDLGFTWERSKDNTVEPSITSQKQLQSKFQYKNLKVEESQSSSVIDTIDSRKNANAPQSNSDVKKKGGLPEPTIDADCENNPTEGRHILFIQMHLCSVQTLADFLASREARCGAISNCSAQKPPYAVDIPFALRLFAQIAHGIKHVHKQGLIHRDLKPQNCFIDDAGIVKVGDFGLSRESSAAGDITDCDENHDDVTVTQCVSLVLPSSIDAENTAGVGTQAYASPEQMRGSDYDASTDVFSLGLILFELLYPMQTAMERYKEFACIRKGNFPGHWNSFVKTSFPTIHDLLVQMISDSAAERPTAVAVSDCIDSLLQEYSVQSLDKSWGKKGALLLRVEAKEKEGILAHTMLLIRNAAPNSTVLQYGLRGQQSKAIMEFALEVEDNDKAKAVEKISSQLEDNGMSVRRVSNS